MKPIILTLHPSRILLLLFISAGTGLGYMLMLLDWNMGLSLLTLMFVLIAMGHVIWRDALLRYPWSWKTLSLDKDRICRITRHDGNSLNMKILAGSYVRPHLTVLQMVPESESGYRFWQRRSILLLPDNCPSDAFRQLRVRLLVSKERDSN